MTAKRKGTGETTMPVQEAETSGMSKREKYLFPELSREGEELTEEQSTVQKAIIQFLRTKSAYNSGSRYASFVADVCMEKAMNEGTELPQMFLQNLPPYHNESTALDMMLGVDQIKAPDLEGLGFLKMEELENPCPLTQMIWCHPFFNINIYIMDEFIMKAWKDAMLLGMVYSGQWGTFQYNKDVRDTLWTAMLNAAKELRKMGYL
jgi:hypothetical protein